MKKYNWEGVNPDGYFLDKLEPILAPLPSFFFSSRRRHTRCLSDWSSDVCSSDLVRFSAFVRFSSRNVPPGMLVTGGTLRDEKRTNAENLTGSAIDGGTPRRVTKRSEERRVGKNRQNRNTTRRGHNNKITKTLAMS